MRQPLLLVFVVAMLGAGTAVSGCGSESEPPSEASDQQTTTPSADSPTESSGTDEIKTIPEPEASAGGYTGYVANTYSVAVKICGHFGVNAVAKDYGAAANASDAATAYSLDSVERDGHRQAAFEGCLAGFRKKK
jgi:hypothetical protein